MTGRFVRLAVFAVLTVLCTFTPAGYQFTIVNVPGPLLKVFVNATVYDHYDVVLDKAQMAGVWSLLVACQGIGCALSSLVAKVPAEWLGRKWSCMGLISVTYLIGSVILMISNACNSFELIMLGRLFMGFGTGLSYTLSPVFLLECTPARYRGIVGSLCFLGVLIGDAFARIIGSFATRDNFSYCLGATVVPAILYLILSPFFPETPKFLLLKRKNVPAAERSIAFYFGGTEHIDNRVRKIKAEEDQAPSVSLCTALKYTVYRTPILCSVAANAAAASGGLFACFTYSSLIFEGFGMKQAIATKFSQSMIGCNLGAGIIQIFLCAFMPRRLQILVGCVALICLHCLMFACSVIVTYGKVQIVGYIGSVLLVLIMITIILTVASTSIFIPPEISLQPGRALAATGGGGARCVGILITQLLFPNLHNSLHDFAFLFFIVFSIFSFVYLLYEMPESRGKTLDEITAKWVATDLANGRDPMAEMGKKAADDQYNALDRSISMISGTSTKPFVH